MERTSARALTAVALSGLSLELNAKDYSLLALTQVAAALRPGSSLTVRESRLLSPLERACISAVTINAVYFDDRSSLVEEDARV
jgi:hypothetical protein